MSFSISFPGILRDLEKIYNNIDQINEYGLIDELLPQFRKINQIGIEKLNAENLSQLNRVLTALKNRMPHQDLQTQAIIQNLIQRTLPPNTETLGQPDPLSTPPPLPAEIWHKIFSHVENRYFGGASLLKIDSASSSQSTIVKRERLENGYLNPRDYGCSSVDKLRELIKEFQFSTVDLSSFKLTPADLIPIMDECRWITALILPEMEIPPEIKNLNNLKLLSLLGSPQLPAEITQLSSLRTLIMHDTTPEIIFQLKQLENLVLHNCSTLSPLVQNLTNLKMLDLSYSPLQTLPEEMNKLVNLEVLDLRGTTLSLPALLTQLPKLKQLILGDTEGLTLQNFEILKKLKEVQIYGINFPQIFFELRREDLPELLTLQEFLLDMSRYEDREEAKKELESLPAFYLILGAKIMVLESRIAANPKLDATTIDKIDDLITQIINQRK